MRPFVNMRVALEQFMHEQPLDPIANPGEFDEFDRLLYLGLFVEWAVAHELDRAQTTEESWLEVFEALGLGNDLGEAWAAVNDYLSKVPSDEAIG